MDLRRIALVAIFPLLLVGISHHSSAEHRLDDPQRITFKAAPCAAACGLSEVLSLDPCGTQVVDGNYDEAVVVAPAESDWLVFESFPEVDWDTVICSPDGRLVSIGINRLGGACKDREQEDQLLIGCSERAETAVRPGERYVLRAFNFSDPSDLPAQYTFHQMIHPRPEADPTDPPTIGGLTSVSSSGNAKVTLRSPRRLRFDYRHIDLRLTDGSFAFVAIVEEQCGMGPEFTCVALGGLLVQDWAPTSFFLRGANNDGSLAEGTFDVYLLTDGQATFELGFRELTGVQAVTADDPVDGEMVRLPEVCQVHTDCRVVLGGSTRDSTVPGFVAAFGYATVPSRTSLGTPNRGSTAADACVKAHDDEGDPADRGCGMFPSDSSIGGIQRARSFAINAATVSQGMSVIRWTQVPPRGPVYAGFAASRVSAEGGDTWGGYGIWLRNV